MKPEERIKALEYQVFQLRIIAGNLPVCEHCDNPAASPEDAEIIDQCGGCIQCWKDDE